LTLIRSSLGSTHSERSWLIVVSESMKTAVSAYTAHPTLERILFTVRTRHERLVSVDVVSDSVSSKALIIAAADYSAIANHHSALHLLAVWFTMYPSAPRGGPHPYA